MNNDAPLTDKQQRIYVADRQNGRLVRVDGLTGAGWTTYGRKGTRVAPGIFDLLGGVAKTLVFALLVSGVGCLRGMRTASGPGAVGDSTTRAVVAGIVLVLIADGIFGVLFYYLRI